MFIGREYNTSAPAAEQSEDVDNGSDDQVENIAVQFTCCSKKRRLIIATL